MKKYNNKKYEYTQSPFYRLHSKRKLSSLLGIPIKTLISVSSKNDNYNIFSVINKNGKSREVQVPKQTLEVIHRQIFKFLKRLETPDYLHSGTKKRSHITNAKAHQHCIELKKLDIKSFYQSTRKDSVYRFFNEKLQCSPDVSEILSLFCTINGHLPTGSKISQVLAFHCNKSMFDEIHNITSEYGCTFTCYVDDLTFSGSHVKEIMMWKIKKIIYSKGYKYHKESSFHKSEPKVVTGVVIKNRELFILNRHHKAIYELRKKFISGIITDQEIASYIGMINSASQINRKFLNYRKKVT